MTATILIVEDEARLAEILEDYLKREGYRTERAKDGLRALELWRAAQPDMILLDLMLPELDGFEVARRIRAESDVPIIMLTARDEEIDKLLGLGLGADDYVRKPFGIRELLARAEAVLRRAAEQGRVTTGADREATEVFRFGPFTLDRPSHKLRHADGQSVPLSPKEYDLLSCFANHSGRALSRDEIMDQVWGYDARVTSRTIDRFVTTLRKKIETDPAKPQFIETIREFGYRFRV